MPSKVRYDLANPTISIRVSREQHEQLDALRFERGCGFKDLILDSLRQKEPIGIVHAGKCSACGEGYSINLNDGKVRAWLDSKVSEAIPKCKACREKENIGSNKT
jgi:hypothetical protein